MYFYNLSSYRNKIHKYIFNTEWSFFFWFFKRKPNPTSASRMLLVIPFKWWENQECGDKDKGERRKEYLLYVLENLLIFSNKSGKVVYRVNGFRSPEEQQIIIMENKTSPKKRKDQGWIVFISHFLNFMFSYEHETVLLSTWSQSRYSKGPGLPQSYILLNYKGKLPLHGESYNLTYILSHFYFHHYYKFVSQEAFLHTCTCRYKEKEKQNIFL